MKWTTLMAVLALALASCGKKEKESDSDEAVEETAESTPIPATPIPATPAPTASATPPPQLAPPGVFFTTTSVSISNDDGIFSLKPGEQVREIAPGRYSAQGQEFALGPHQVTNDLRVAGQVRGADSAMQAALRQGANPAAPPAGQRGMPGATSTALSRPTAGTRPSTPAPGFVPGVNTQRTGMQSSSALGSGHTKTDDGWLWQKSPDGQWWTPVKPVSSRSNQSMPSPRPVR